MELEEILGPANQGEELTAPLEAGLAPAFKRDEAVIVGSAEHSAMRMLGHTIEISRVALRESEADKVEPMNGPDSIELPTPSADSRYQLQGEIARGGMGLGIKGRDHAVA